MKKYYSLLILLMSTLLNTASAANVEKIFCVFDIAGASGDLFPIMSDYAAKAASWGVTFKLKAYSSEDDILRDFRSGKCDVANILGVTARKFNEFTGSIDSFGAVPDYSHLKSLLRILANPKLAKFMRSNSTEVIGILPYGSVHLWSKGRYSTLNDYIGKRLVVLEKDQAQSRAARIFGLKPVATTLDNFANTFNYGASEIIVSPKVGFKAFDLVQGIGGPSQGGYSEPAVAQLTVQVLMKSGSITIPNFGQNTRRYFYQNFNNYLRIVKRNDSSVDSAYEIQFKDDIESFNEMMRQVRIQLTQRGIYNRTMMRLIKRVRCRKDPSQSECSDKSE